MPSAPPEPPSPMTAAMIGHFEQRHFAQIDGDGFGDVPFLRGDAGIRARRVNQA